jgi:phage tail-like protein
MSRPALSGIASPHPLGQLLPGVYLDDDFVQRWTDGLDEVLAPILVTIDCLDAYFDCGTAPIDFVRWLGGWVDSDLDERWPDTRIREVVGSAGAGYAAGGTARALIGHVRRTCGVEVEVVESGGVVWSCDPDTDAPGDDRAFVAVTLLHHVEAEAMSQIARAVDEIRPAHVRVEIRSCDE